MMDTVMLHVHGTTIPSHTPHCQVPFRIIMQKIYKTSITRALKIIYIFFYYNVLYVSSLPIHLGGGGGRNHIFLFKLLQRQGLVKVIALHEATAQLTENFQLTSGFNPLGDAPHS